MCSRWEGKEQEAGAAEAPVGSSSRGWSLCSWLDTLSLHGLVPVSTGPSLIGTEAGGLFVTSLSCSLWKTTGKTEGKRQMS